MIIVYILAGIGAITVIVLIFGLIITGRDFKPTKMDVYCTECKLVTKHLYYDTGHERDSSYDHVTCTICDNVQYAWSEEKPEE